MRPSSVRSLSTLVLGLVLVLAGCTSDSPTSPQIDGTTGLISTSSATMTSDLEGAGFRADEIDPSDVEYDGEEGPFEHAVRAPNGVELIFRFAGRIRARQEVAITLRARSNGQAVDGKVEVDFGDGRGTQTFDIFRKTELVHTYREEGRFRIFAILEDNEGRTARGGFRVHIRPPLRVNLVVETPEGARPDEETVLLVEAEPMNDEARDGEVHGSLTIDFGDGESAFIKNFTGTARRTHVYSDEKTYTVKLTLEAGDRTFEDAVKIEVREGFSGAGVDDIPANDVIYLDAAIAKWNMTSKVTGVTINPGSQICIFHSKSGLWPAPFENPVEGNVWVFAKINGQWYGATWEWIKVGQNCKHIEAAFPRFATPAPMSLWRPKPGELVGWATSTHARNNRRTVNERSNIALVPWPQ